MSASKNGQPELTGGTSPARAPESPPVTASAEETMPSAQSVNQVDTKKDKPIPDRKIGLVTFLQVSGANKYVEAMLRSKNAMEAHTKAEWEQIVKNLLNKKVR